MIGSLQSVLYHEHTSKTKNNANYYLKWILKVGSKRRDFLLLFCLLSQSSCSLQREQFIWWHHSSSKRILLLLLILLFIQLFKIHVWVFFFMHYSTAPVTRTSVQIAGGQQILNHTFTLTCETMGSVKSLIWMYNWSPLVVDSTKSLSMDNTTLTFSPIVQTDNGNYQCVASNPLSNNTGGFTLKYFCEFCISILKVLKCQMVLWINTQFYSWSFRQESQRILVNLELTIRLPPLILLRDVWKILFDWRDQCRIACWKMKLVLATSKRGIKKNPAGLKNYHGRKKHLF